MMARFCTYLDKVFDFTTLFSRLRDNRVQPQIPTATVFACVFTMQATRRGSLNGWEHDAVRLPHVWHEPLQQLAAECGADSAAALTIPSPDTLGRVYARMDSDSLRDVLAEVHQQLTRNKVLQHDRPLTFLAVDGHEFHASRKRCCPHCQQRTVKVGPGKEEEVVEYYHRGVVAQLVGPEIAVPLDVELQRPGEGEVAAAQRLIERLRTRYPRAFDAVLADALYFEAPFINFCRGLGVDVLVVVKGEQRLLLQDAEALFAARPPSDTWIEQQGRRKRTVAAWDESGFTSCTGVSEPLRVIHTHETLNFRERVADEWKETQTESDWWWATTISSQRLPTRPAWSAGHGRWQIENEGFNVLSQHWGLDHMYKHDATALVNFTLTLLLVYVLLQCFFHRNLKSPARKAVGPLISLACRLHQELATMAGGGRRPTKTESTRPASSPPPPPS